MWPLEILTPDTCFWLWGGGYPYAYWISASNDFDWEAVLIAEASPQAKWRFPAVVAALGLMAMLSWFLITSEEATAHRPVCGVNALGGYVTCHSNIRDPRVSTVCTTPGSPWRWRVVNENTGSVFFFGQLTNCGLEFEDANPYAAAGARSQMNNCANAPSSCADSGGSNNFGRYTVGHR